MKGGQTRWGTARRVLVAVSSVLAVFCALLVVTALIVTKTAKGRDFLVARIESLYDSRLQGSLRIGSIDHVDGFAADASDVRFRDPRGRDVIRVRKAHVRVEPLELLHGRLALRDTWAEGATVRLARGRSHKTSVQDAFAKEAGQTPRRLEVDTGTMRVRSAEMIVTMGGPTIAVRGIHGSIRVTRVKKDPADVQLSNVAGRITFPDIHILRDRDFRVRGVVHAKRFPRLVMHVRGCFPRGEFPMYVRFSPGSLYVRFDPSDDHIMGAILGAVGRFSDLVDTKRGTVDMRGLSPCE